MKKEDIYDMPNIGCLLGIAYQAELARLAAALSAAGLEITTAEYVIMRMLYTHSEMQQCELSRIIGKDKASVSRSVKSLADKELVENRQLSYKCSIVSLSDKGQSMMPRLLEIAKQQQNLLSEKITQRQMETLREILQTIINK